MQPSNNPLIEQLAQDLVPVRALKTRDGLLLVGLAAIATILVVAFFHGVWMDGLTGTSLEVDLSSRQIRRVQIPEGTWRAYLGGAGVAARGAPWSVLRSIAARMWSRRPAGT